MHVHRQYSKTYRLQKMLRFNIFQTHWRHSRQGPFCILSLDCYNLSLLLIFVLKSAAQGAQEALVKKQAEINHIQQQMESIDKACKQDLANHAITLRATERQLEALKASQMQAETSTKEYQSKILMLQDELKAAQAARVRGSGGCLFTPSSGLLCHALSPVRHTQSRLPPLTCPRYSSLWSKMPRPKSVLWPRKQGPLSRSGICFVIVVDNAFPAYHSFSHTLFSPSS